ncbi:hypothetical protein GCM10027271_02150 [Saccharopolyspora gloriosae]
MNLAEPEGGQVDLGSRSPERRGGLPSERSFVNRPRGARAGSPSLRFFARKDFAVNSKTVARGLALRATCADFQEGDGPLLSLVTPMAVPDRSPRRRSRRSEQEARFLLNDASRLLRENIAVPAAEPAGQTPVAQAT